MNYEDDNLIVAPSKIHGLGLFAKRDFKKGEVVSEWNPVRLIPVSEYKNLSAEEKKVVSRYDSENYAEVGVPSRYVNHSDDPNVVGLEGKDIAIKDIVAGQEITANYNQEGAAIDF